MIVAASTTLLADSRSGGKGGLLPWALLAAPRSELGQTTATGANSAQ
jgi:hypothetical protein